MVASQLSAAAEESTQEIEIDFAADLKDGQMRELKVGPGEQDKVLVTRYQGKLHAVGNYCSHFGAPLSTGQLFDDKIVCPWHAAAFSVVTGALEGAPGLDGLPTFGVVEREGRWFAQVPVGQLPRKKTQHMAQRDPSDRRRFVIVGGGPAALYCVETLRQSGFTGEIVMISAESMVPYDRTLLTKALPMADASKLKLRDENFLEKVAEVRLGVKAISVDPSSKTVHLSDGSVVTYDKLCVATGAAPFRPQIPGIDLANVLVLRSHEDQEEIKKQAVNAKDVVIIGGGFIGSESAAALKDKFKDAQNVHMIYSSQFPLQSQLGDKVGEFIAIQHEKNGVVLHPGKKATQIKGVDGKATAVVLDDGSELAADLVLVGAGALPATKFLAGSGVRLDKWGAVVCDPFLQSSVADVYAAGDICAYPSWVNGQLQRIEHYSSAMNQGSHAAFNMLGKLVPYANVPFFWTRHYNKAIQYGGFAVDYDEVYISGNMEEGKFIAFYADKQGKILAVSGCMQSAAVLTYIEAMQQNLMPSLKEIKYGKETWETVRAKLKSNKGASKCKRENCCHKKA